MIDWNVQKASISITKTCVSSFFSSSSSFAILLGCLMDSQSCCLNWTKYSLTKLQFYVFIGWIMKLMPYLLEVTKSTAIVSTSIFNINGLLEQWRLSLNTISFQLVSKHMRIIKWLDSHRLLFFYFEYRWHEICKGQFAPPPELSPRRRQAALQES